MNACDIKNLKDIIITNEMNIVRIIVDDVVIDNDRIDWDICKEDGSDEQYEFLSLEKIYCQMHRKYNFQIIYVWVESPLEGTIYQCGNYKNGEWIEHGKTKGYA